MGENLVFAKYFAALSKVQETLSKKGQQDRARSAKK